MRRWRQSLGGTVEEEREFGELSKKKEARISKSRNAHRGGLNLAWEAGGGSSATMEAYLVLSIPEYIRAIAPGLLLGQLRFAATRLSMWALRGPDLLPRRVWRSSWGCWHPYCEKRE